MRPMECIEIVSLQEARSRGLKHYFTGQPCKRGHLCRRFESDRQCAECKKESLEKWRASKTDHLINYRKDYYSENRDTISQRRSASRPGRRERLNAATKEWREANLDRVLNYSREYYRANKEEMAERHSKWCKDNSLKCRLYVEKRRSLKVGSFSEDDIKEIMKHQRGRCAYYKICGKSIRNQYDIDHIIALSKGGSNLRSNLQLLCQNCNRTKSNKDPIVFSRQRGMLL
jgi:5-methylcytosine-specific restriction endonuclease McrA